MPPSGGCGGNDRGLTQHQTIHVPGGAVHDRQHVGAGLEVVARLERAGDGDLPGRGEDPRRADLAGGDKLALEVQSAVRPCGAASNAYAAVTRQAGRSSCVQSRCTAALLVG